MTTKVTGAKADVKTKNGGLVCMERGPIAGVQEAADG